jgi:glycosyltransferase involved in cell wall biosynthesis
MDNNKPLVSVIIPTYKRPDKLDRAIDSVLSQTYQNVEAIVVDDNNPDTEGRKLTEAKMAPYSGNPRVKYVKHEHNKNGSAARNTGARASDAKYIAFLDDDDEFYPEKIAAQVQRLEELPDEYAVCYTDVVIEKENGKISVSTERREGDLYFDALTRELVLMAGSNLLIRKDAFDSIGGFDESFIRSQDKELVTRLLKKYKIARAPIKGVHIYVYSDHSFFNPIEVTEKYVSAFKSDIDELPADKKKKFYSIITKDKFWYYFRHNKDYRACLKMVMKGEISVITALGILCEHAKKLF